MEQVVSKERRKKAKQRGKKQRGGQDRSLTRGPAMAFFIMVVLWLGTFFLIRTHELLAHQGDHTFSLNIAGQAVLGIAAIVSLGLFLNSMRPEYVTRNSRLVLLTLAALLGLGAAELVLYGGHSDRFYGMEVAPFLIPYAMAPILVTLLLGSRAAFVVGLWVTLALALRTRGGDEDTILFTGLLATAIAGHMTRFCCRWTRVIQTGVFVGASTAICVVAYSIATGGPDDISVLANEAAAALLGGLLSAMLALLLLRAFEQVFDITTDITLLEFSNLGHPLLQRMALEAPGTYHHSLVVANIAQAAADAIGANALEARVCAYYHDIGKLTKPNFFTENIQMQQNPHDDLPPSMSTLVITAHVKEGIALAMQHKLPRPVMRAIREHHGNSTLSYFHHKAKTQLELKMRDTEGHHDESIVDETAFRYGGPRPSTKVSAILCLADAVEAASRSLEKATPGHIEVLVADIVRMRIEDGQLDACDLKMCELTQVRKAFVFTLTNMLHARVPYPKDESKNKDKSQPATPQRAKGEVAGGKTGAKGTGAEPRGVGNGDA